MKFHHIGIATSDIEAECRFYQSIGATDISQIYDDHIQNVRILFLILGGVRIELVSPLSEGSPVDRYINKKIRMYHTCYEVTELDFQIDQLISAGGILVLPPTRAIALNNRNVAFVLTKNNDLIELLEDGDEV